MGIPKDGDGNNDDNKEIRPAASLEYLLPAARVGVYVYQVLALAEELAKLQASSSSQATSAKLNETIQELDNLLVSSPPTFIKSTDPKVTRGDPYKLPPIVGEFAMQQQKQRERQQQSIEVGMAPQFFEVGELVGERSQWNRLKQQEQARENASPVRRALNIYTTNLNFNPNKYVYSGTKEEKKRLIREDKLPTTTDVIRSDLDARDLYRNALQTALEDSTAEFLYQKKNKFEDPSDLVGLLKDAKVAIDKWFSFIPDEDIQSALEVVKREQSS
jgi:hypothetical protein